MALHLAAAKWSMSVKVTAHPGAQHLSSSAADSEFRSSLFISRDHLSRSSAHLRQPPAASRVF
eukprot:8331768-Pyramimonas_sp.AAC.1